MLRSQFQQLISIVQFPDGLPYCCAVIFLLLKQLPEDARLDTALEALARSLCSLDAVAETRFLVDGEFAAFYGPVDISEPFAYPEAPAG